MLINSNYYNYNDNTYIYIYIVGRGYNKTYNQEAPLCPHYVGI